MDNSLANSLNRFDNWQICPLGRVLRRQPVLFHCPNPLRPCDSSACNTNCSATKPLIECIHGRHHGVLIWYFGTSKIKFACFAVAGRMSRSMTPALISWKPGR